MCCLFVDLLAYLFLLYLYVCVIFVVGCGGGGMSIVSLFASLIACVK